MCKPLKRKLQKELKRFEEISKDAYDEHTHIVRNAFVNGALEGYDRRKKQENSAVKGLIKYYEDKIDYMIMVMREIKREYKING